MPKVEVEGRGTFDVAEGTKLVLALEDNGVDILHRCGGNARCTTCRVEVLAGDPGPMNENEAAIRRDRGISEDHIRLSCQIRVHADLKVRPVMTASATGTDPGPRPAE